MRRSLPLLRFVAGLVAWLAGTVPAAAQCSMCQLAAEEAAGSPRAAAAFNAGVLVLLVPALGLVTGIGVLAWKARTWDGSWNQDRSQKW